MEVLAKTKNVGVSPKKLKWIVDTVRGKRVDEAMVTLKFLPSPAAREVLKVVKSAAANAENNFHMDTASLKILRISADKGMTLRRADPKPRGRAGEVNKRYSYITVVVTEEE